MTPTPTDGPDAASPASGPSLFDDLLAEHAEPMKVRVAGLDWTIDVPAAEDVADLDDCADGFDVLDDLLGDTLDGELHPLLVVLDDQPSWMLDDLAQRVLDHFHLVDAPPGGWAMLVRRIDCYGAAIEAELPHHWPGIELEQWFTGRRRWPQLYRLLEQLPPGSRWHAALLSDKELAQAEIDEEAERDDDDDDEPEPEEPRPPLVGEDHDRALRRAMVTVLRRIEHALYAVNAPRGKAGNAPPALKGPRTARDELMRDDGMDDLYALFRAVDPEWRHPDEVGQDPPSGYRATESGLIVPGSSSTTTEGG